MAESEGVFVRAAAAGDMARAAGIFGHYVTTSVATFETVPPTEDDWLLKLADLTGSGLPFLVCERDGRVAGYAYVAPWRTKPVYRHTVEDSIYVAPGHTGQGLGKLLLRSLLEACALAGLEQVIAVIADGGDPASVALHHAAGFTDAGRLRNVGHKHGRLLDTLLMQRDLTA
jgi:phosphinothricin acetyltransferase